MHINTKSENKINLDKKNISRIVFYLHNGMWKTFLVSGGQRVLSDFTILPHSRKNKNKMNRKAARNLLFRIEMVR
jgi:hypothetical protein